jgi:hypothetical protein
MIIKSLMVAQIEICETLIIESANTAARTDVLLKRGRGEGIAEER